MANVPRNLETSAVIGVNSPTSKALVIASGLQNAAITLIGSDNSTLALVIGPSSSAQFKISALDYAASLLIIQCVSDGTSAIIHAGYSDFASIISQSATSFITSGTPTTSQHKLTFQNTGSIVTITNGSTLSRGYNVIAISTRL